MHEVWFENDGTRLFAVEEGDGLPLVMLHGGMASHAAVLPAVASLGAKYRVITPDQRGSGRSVCGSPLTFDRLVTTRRHHPKPRGRQSIRPLTSAKYVSIDTLPRPYV
jgi:pimeloyl-ACP methyl ester carboxylesterase